MEQGATSFDLRAIENCECIRLSSFHQVAEGLDLSVNSEHAGESNGYNRQLAPSVSCNRDQTFQTNIQSNRFSAGPWLLRAFSRPSAAELAACSVGREHGETLSHLPKVLHSQPDVGVVEHENVFDPPREGSDVIRKQRVKENVAERRIMGVRKIVGKKEKRLAKRAKSKRKYECRFCRKVWRQKSDLDVSVACQPL